MIFLFLFLTFFKIGICTFGGGYAMLPLIQSEVVSNNWMTETELINFVAVSESTPGPFAVNIATYIGSEVGGAFGASLGSFWQVFFSIVGSVVSTLGVVMPSFIIILIVASFYEKFCQSKIVRGLMSGLRPAAIGLIGYAFLSLMFTIFFGGKMFALPEGAVLSAVANPSFYASLVIFGGMFFISIKKVHPIIIIGISAVLGILCGYIFNLFGVAL